MITSANLSRRLGRVKLPLRSIPRRRRERLLARLRAGEGAQLLDSGEVAVYHAASACDKECECGRIRSQRNVFHQRCGKTPGEAEPRSSSRSDRPASRPAISFASRASSRGAGSFRAQGAKLLAGQVTFVVMSEAATREPHRLIAATVGVAIPRDRELYGYLSEHHSFGESEEIAGDYAEELAAEMLATTLGLDFDPDKSWDVKKEVYRLSNQIVRTQNVTQTSIGDKKGLWTTVVAAAVLVG